MKKPSKNPDSKTAEEFSDLHDSTSEKEGSAGIPKYLTVAQVAEILEVSKDYVRTLIKNRHLESVKLPGGSASPVRISADSLQNLINSSKASCQIMEQAASKRKRKRKPYYGVFSV